MISRDRLDPPAIMSLKNVKFYCEICVISRSEKSVDAFCILLVQFTNTSWISIAKKKKNLISRLFVREK